jgi:hypothetical protein
LGGTFDRALVHETNWKYTWIYSFYESDIFKPIVVFDFDGKRVLSPIVFVESAILFEESKSLKLITVATKTDQQELKNMTCLITYVELI